MTTPILDDHVRQLQEPARQPGASVPVPVPSVAGVGVREIGGGPAATAPQHLLDGRLLNRAGPAYVATGNVWAGTPQLEMELGAWTEQACVANAAGPIALDVDVANAWYLSLSGDAVVSIAQPPAIPADQMAAGCDRNRAAGIALLVARNGHALSFDSAIGFPKGSSDLLHDSANLDLFVFAWWGGPDVASTWLGKVVDSGFEAWGA